jgi:hypothetical protein
MPLGRVSSVLKFSESLAVITISGGAPGTTCVTILFSDGERVYLHIGTVIPVSNRASTTRQKEKTQKSMDSKVFRPNSTFN